MLARNLKRWPIIMTGPFETGPVVDNFDVNRGDVCYSREAKGDMVTDSYQVAGYGQYGEPDCVWMSVTIYLHGVQIDHYVMIGAGAVGTLERCEEAYLEPPDDSEMPF